MRAMTMARPDTVRGARARWLRRAVMLLPLALGACGYNTIQTLDETSAKSQKEIEVQLQRRADLIPNLVATVKGFAAQEKSIFESVAKAWRFRAKRPTPSGRAYFFIAPIQRDNTPNDGST